MPEVLYEEVIEVDERLIPHQPCCQLPGTEAMPLLQGGHCHCHGMAGGGTRVTLAIPSLSPPGFSAGSTGGALQVQRPLDLAALRQELERVLARGITSLAVLLLHSYA